MTNPQPYVIRYDMRDNESYSLIELNLREAMAMFVLFGLPPGGMTTHIILGNKMQAFHRAHPHFRVDASKWADGERVEVTEPEGSIFEMQYSLIRNNLPDDLKDSPAMYDKWKAGGGYHGSADPSVCVQLKLTELDDFWTKAGGPSVYGYLMSKELARDIDNAVLRKLMKF